MNKLILLLAILSLMVSCQEKAITTSKNYYNIEDVTIDLKAEDYKKHLESDSIILQTEKYNAVTQIRINEKETEKGKKFVWKQYNFLNAKREQSVGHLSDMKLRAMHFITYKNYLIGVTGSSMYSDSIETKKTIHYLTQKFGKPVDLEYPKSLIDKKLLYYWQSKNKIIGISFFGQEGDYLTMADFNNRKATLFPVYEIYVFNKDAIDILKTENIDLEDLFNGGSTGLAIQNVNNILSHIKRSEEYPSLE